MRALLAGAGTPEAAWQAWSPLRRLPAWQAPAGRLVVVAPHPDDEVLGVGGLLALHRAAGGAVALVAVTDGDASHPDSRALLPRELVALRRAERHRALGLLGLRGVPVVRLGLPDGDVGRHESRLAGDLADLLRPGDVCLATWKHDGHPDHEATGRAAATASAAAVVPLVAFPVWTWHWAEPGDARVPWERARRVELPPSTARAKRSAAAAFHTQVRAVGGPPVLPPEVLARLTRDIEVVLV